MRNSRILERLKFVKKNYRLCHKAFTIVDCSHKHWKEKHGRKLVDKARRKIGYSNSTANCDIFWSLKGIYQWYRDNILID